MDHHYNILGTWYHWWISTDIGKKKGRIDSPPKKGEEKSWSKVMQIQTIKKHLKALQNNQNSQQKQLRLRPNSPPARQAAAPVRGGLEPGRACWKVELIQIVKSTWNYFDWTYRQKYGRKWNDRPHLPHLWPPGVDSRGVGCGDNWTGGGGLRGKRLTEVTQLMDIKTPRPLDIMLES